MREIAVANAIPSLLVPRQTEEDAVRGKATTQQEKVKVEEPLEKNDVRRL